MKRLFALITALLCILLLVPSAALATGIGLSENTASFYIATGFDLKRCYYKKYDVYRGSSAGLGAGLRQELVGTEAVLAHVPHRVEYSVSSTVGY
mgnify:CR=1 FL=1